MPDPQLTNEITHVVTAEITKLSVKPGDVVVCTLNKPGYRFSGDEREYVRMILQSMLPNGVSVVVVSDVGLSLDVVTAITTDRSS